MRKKFHTLQQNLTLAGSRQIVYETLLRLPLLIPEVVSQSLLSQNLKTSICSPITQSGGSGL